MSQYENPELLDPEHEITLEDVRALTAASTPHFSLQIRTRLQALLERLPPEHPARLECERQIARMNEIAFDGEVRGRATEDGLPPLVSVSPQAANYNGPQ